MSTATKTPLAAAQQTAGHILEALNPFCHRIAVAGSIRRQRPQIGDIEIVALPQRQTDLLGITVPGLMPIEAFLQERGVNIIKGGYDPKKKTLQKYIQFQYGRYAVDLFMPESPAHWGSVFTIRTGSHDFNMWLMNTRAPAVSIKFIGGLLYTWQRQLIPTPEEGDVFEALQMEFVPPGARDNNKWLGYVREA
jgi:DNA polymerase/3'-5' exonuclease PolX